MSPLLGPDTKAMLRVAEELTEQVRSVADALTTPVTTAAPEADIQRVTALYERWVKAGPPPLGTSLTRWWDERLVELREAILPPEVSTEGPS
ncbi:hypothetical protein [Streptomyces sp. NBC_00443]|uniref:hypothetical protein n=1 Tax=Streptomyces sp. NBC_00443 TaxID=2975743 RepID=UPI002E20C7C5